MPSRTWNASLRWRSTSSASATVSTIDSDIHNAELVADMQEAGIAAPSTTTIDGKLAIRAAIVNHRTRAEDIAILVDAVLALGRRRAAAIGV